jgi:hypothetical protein
MRLNFKGGKFDIEAWTDGSPVWSRISYGLGADARAIITNLHPSELEDLEYVVHRMRKAIKQQCGKREGT